MTISAYASGIVTGTIGIEQFVSSPNVEGKFRFIVDLSAMVLGDYTELRCYQMVIAGGTPRVAYYDSYQGPQPSGAFVAVSDELWNELTDTNALRFSIFQSLGTARAYPWKVSRQSDSGGPGSDPWETSLPGSYTPGQAGYILASRMPTGTVIVGSNLDKTGYSLSSPQTYDRIGYTSGTMTAVLNVINPVTAGNVTGSVLGNVNGSVNSVTQPVGISTGTLLDAMADKVWDEQLSGHLADGAAGHILFSRMPTGTVVVGSNQDKTGYSLSSPQNFDLVGNISGTLSNVLNVINPVTAGNVTGSVFGNVNGSVASVTNPVGLNTGTLISSIADGVWDEQLSGHLQAGSTGEKLNTGGDPWGIALPGIYTAGQAGHILASRMPTGTVIVGQNNDKLGYSLASPQAFDLIGNISGTLTNVLNVVYPVVAGSVTGSVLGNVNGSVASVTNPVGINTGSFIGAIADGVWDEQIAGHLSAGSTGEKLNAASSAGDPWTTSLPGSYVAGQAGYILASRMPTGTVIVGQNNDKTGYGLATGSLLDAIADTVWDEQLGGHLVTGSAGRRLNDAADGGSDPWATSLPALYTSGQAGYILGTNLDARVSSRMASGTVSVAGLNPALLDVAVSSRLASGTFAANYTTPPTASQIATETLSQAASNPIDSNVKQINDTTITGDGSTTPWGPA